MRNVTTGRSRDSIEPTTPRSAMRPALMALALFVIAASARIGHLAVFEPAARTPGLTAKFTAIASHVLAGEGFMQQVGRAPVPFCDRMPGYVLVLAGLMLLAPASLAVAHALLGALQAPLVAALAERVASPRAGWAAGLACALFPPLWLWDAQVMDTAPSGLAVTATLIMTWRAFENPSWTRSVGLAVVTTAAFAMRPDAMLLPAVVAAVLLARRRIAAWRPVLLVLATPVLVASLWAARNARVAGEPFVAVGFGTNLLGAVGESLATDRPLLDDRGVARHEGHDSLFWPDPAPRDRERRRLAIQLIRENPRPYALGCARRLAVTLSFYSGALWGGEDPVEHLRRWRREHPGRGRHEGFTSAVLSLLRDEPIRGAATLVWGPLLLGLVALGLGAGAMTRADVACLLALPVYALAVHLPLHAEPRYFVPFAGPLLVVAGVGLAAIGRRRSLARHQRSPAGAPEGMIAPPEETSR